MVMWACCRCRGAPIRLRSAERDAVAVFQILTFFAPQDKARPVLSRPQLRWRPLCPPALPWPAASPRRPSRWRAAPRSPPGEPSARVAGPRSARRATPCAAARSACGAAPQRPTGLASAHHPCLAAAARVACALGRVRRDPPVPWPRPPSRPSHEPPADPLPRPRAAQLRGGGAQGAGRSPGPPRDAGFRCAPRAARRSPALAGSRARAARRSGRAAAPGGARRARGGGGRLGH